MTVREAPALAKDASALHQVTADDAPFLIMHGDQDPGVPVTQSKRLHAALRHAGVDSELRIIEGAGHGGKLFRTETARQHVLRFFRRTLVPSWPQGSGPNASFRSVDGSSPQAWSVVRNESIRWRKTLPETGQSTVTVSGGRIFFSTMEPVQEDSELGSNIVAWCCDAKTGKTLWKQTIKGSHPLRLSGCFSDSSAPPPVTDGQRVCFFNASGTIACFDLDGKPQWTKQSMAAGRSQPSLVDERIVYTRQSYMPDEKGHFSHKHKNAPKEQWTQLEAIDIATGNKVWESECGVNMGSVPLPQWLPDGKRVLVVGRGGGHSPPETPEGISLADADDGATLWTLPLPGFMSTMTYPIVGNQVLLFHDDEHLWVNASIGKIERRVSFLAEASTRVRDDESWVSKTQTLPAPKKKRAIIQQSNVLVGDYHYFRSYTMPYLGRVHVSTGKVEYLQLPVQLKRTAGDEQDQLLWDESGMRESLVQQLKKKGRKTPKQLPIQQLCFAPNDMKNSRGFVVMGDARSRGVGWGHHASQLPTAVGDRLYVPVMNGTVYVLNAAAAKWDESAIVAINDLGPVGQSFNRASLSYANGRLYAHTIREIICIEAKQNR